jgi:hypothetical protein
MLTQTLSATPAPSKAPAQEIPSGTLPCLSVHLPDNQVHGAGWPTGSRVSVYVDDPSTAKNPDFDLSGVVDQTLFDQSWIVFDFKGITDLKTGYLVTMTDGIVEKSHRVRDVSVLIVDPIAMQVIGKASPNTIVDVASQEGLDAVHVIVEADASGNWTADFGTDGNVTFKNVVAAQRDEDGDITYFTKRP